MGETGIQLHNKKALELTSEKPTKNLKQTGAKGNDVLFINHAI